MIPRIKEGEWVEHHERVDNRLHFHLVTNHRWLTGHLHTVHRRLIDLLNSDQNPSLLLRDVSIGVGPHRPRLGSVLDDPVVVVIDRIYFAVPQDAVSHVVTPRPSDAWIIRKANERAVVGIGQYEIIGDVHFAEGGDVCDTFLTSGPPFFAVTNAEIRRMDGTLSIDSPVVVVNRLRTDYLTPIAVRPSVPVTGDVASFVD
ncbi:MAG: hypothetical protein ACYC4L_14480 [Chloroflexota bacterium]